MGKKYWENLLGNNSWGKNSEKKILGKIPGEIIPGKKILGKIPGKKILGKNSQKKLLGKTLGK